MDTLDAAMKLVGIEWDAHHARLAYESLRDDDMRDLLEKIVANAQEIIAWVDEVDRVKV